MIKREWFMRHRLELVILMGTMLILLAGCCKKKLYEPHTVDSQPEAGIVNLSVTLVAPWEDYIEDLKPNFELTGDEALKKVIPRTTLLEEKILDALSLKAKFGLPQTGTTITRTTSKTGGDVTSDLQKTQKL